VCFWWWVDFCKGKKRCQNLDHLAHHTKLHTLRFQVKITTDQRLKVGLHSMNLLFHVMNQGKNNN
jgi:head-tail adaptor